MTTTLDKEIARLQRGLPAAYAEFRLAHAPATGSGSLGLPMVSAYGDDERKRHADELGAAELLTRPVDFDALKAQLRQLPTAAE